MAKLQTTPAVAPDATTKKLTKSLTAMVTITGFSDGAKARRKITAAKQTAEQKKAKLAPNFYFTAAYNIKSVVDTQYEAVVGAPGISCNIFGSEAEIKEIHAKVGKEPITAYLYADKKGDLLLMLRPRKITKAQFAEMAGATKEEQAEVSANASRFVNIVDDSELGQI